MAWNIDLNSAGVEILEKFPFIGRQRAEAIVKYREENGLFRSWDDLKHVPGFSASLVDNLKNQGFNLGKRAA